MHLPEISRPLSARQRRLVEKNMGLVGTHLKHFMKSAVADYARREFDDLFQEGCLGLIQAARIYDRSRGIPFIPFALPRIRTAIYRAMFSDEGDGPNDLETAADADLIASDFDFLPVVAPARRLPLPILNDDPAPSRRQEEQTVGQRLREKFESALRSLFRAPGFTAEGDAVYTLLVERILDERLRIGDEKNRTPLRQIARELKISNSRAVRCEHRLERALRCLLRDDDEFQTLLEIAEDSANLNDHLDQEAADRLTQLTARQFARTVCLCPPSTRQTLMNQLIDSLAPEGDPGEFDSIVRAFALLPRPKADELASAAAVAAKDPSRRRERRRALRRDYSLAGVFARPPGDGERRRPLRRKRRSTRVKSRVGAEC